MDIIGLLEKMTVDEKIGLLSGKDFWRTVDYDKYGIRAIEVSDGPCGLRKQVEDCDHLGFNVSMPATAYPSGPAVAATWNTELIEKLGVYLGVESQAFNVDILLGPAMNIHRSPLCGRNFEYYSEDPFLTGEVAGKYVSGVQSKGIGACLKHFAANNQETEREYINSAIDERALREIYLYGFEKAIKMAKPWAVMTALNKLNSVYCSENKTLLNDILREEWKFDGIVMSDWWGVNNRSKALKAGLDLEMPYSDGIGARRIKESYIKGELDLSYIDDACTRIIACSSKKTTNAKELGIFDYKEHHEFAQKFAEESIVLLKNQDSILPLNQEDSVGVIGEFAVEPKFKMTGSALVNPTMYDRPLDEINNILNKRAEFARGYSKYAEEKEKLLLEAIEVAKNNEKIIIFTGLPDGIESEGKDRKNMLMPKNHIRLINEVCKVNSNVIIILCNGGAVEMSWQDEVKGIFECFLAGQGMGKAISSLLFGIKNPSGKLPITIPKQLSHISSYVNFPGNKIDVEYKESIFVGYRYFDTIDIEPLYPFGFGLSYTDFAFYDIKVEKKERGVDVSLNVKNIGNQKGEEVIQVYIGKEKSRAIRSKKELKGFAKINLDIGESKNINIHLSKRDFAYYNVDIGDWYIENGNYSIMVGNSSRNILLTEYIEINEPIQLPKKITGWSKIGRLRETKAGRNALKEMREIIKGDFCLDSLRELFLNKEKQDELDEIRIRFIILQTQTVINNDIIETYLKLCNDEYISNYLEEIKNCEKEC